MSSFSIFFGIGVDHILSSVGLDHVLFVVALAAVYQLRDWKNILILVTAFTLGHSVTLALATLGIIALSSQWVELLIPVTILITGITNIFRSENKKGNIYLHYAVILLFGFIHGMGFSATLNAMLGGQSLIMPLLGFNLGLELGQIVVIAVFMLLSAIFVSKFGFKPRDWRIVISSIIVGMALMLITERIQL